MFRIPPRSSNATTGMFVDTFARLMPLMKKPTDVPPEFTSTSSKYHVEVATAPAPDRFVDVVPLPALVVTPVQLPLLTALLYSMKTPFVTAVGSALSLN